MVTEKYWALLELMRQEFLADIAEYYACIAPNIQASMQPAYSGKLSKMKHVIQRLSASPLPGLGIDDSLSITAAPVSCAPGLQLQAFLRQPMMINSQKTDMSGLEATPTLS